MNLPVNRINSYIFGRNEGKIKSYGSCTDLRAWSHDGKVRDRYLRDWIKSDMPIYVISAHTLIALLKIMTIKSNGQKLDKRAYGLSDRKRLAHEPLQCHCCGSTCLVPRCHPNCKSKIVLDSICTSCHIMKECLKSSQNVQDFLVKEEFETSHWPCDKCLEVLKTIKMFWKIIVEKLFHIERSTDKDTNLQQTTYIRVENIRSVTRTWQKDIIDDVLLLKKITPISKNPFSKETKYNPQTNVTEHAVNETTVINKSQQFNMNKDNKDDTSLVRKKRRKLNKATSVNLHFVDVACDIPEITKYEDNIRINRENTEKVQNSCDLHLNEIEKLKAENDSLKIELRNIYETHPWKYALYNKNRSDFDSDARFLMPKPFDDNISEVNSVNNLESEMVITMKNCCNKNFKHVSVLKVLHKTNKTNSIGMDEECLNNENPLRFLTRVQTTFGEIVKRELSMVNDKNTIVTSDYETAFNNVNCSKSAPSCSTMSTISSLKSNYVSVKGLNVIVQQ